MPRFDFRYKYQDMWHEKDTQDILLANPAPMEFRYQPNHGAESIVCVGDTINDTELSSLEYFLKELEGV